MELMRFTGWSWRDLKETPASVVQRAIHRMTVRATKGHG